MHEWAESRGVKVIDLSPGTLGGLANSIRKKLRSIEEL